MKSAGETLPGITAQRSGLRCSGGLCRPIESPFLSARQTQAELNPLGYCPKLVTASVSPLGFFAFKCAFLPSMLTTSKFSVLATLIVMPSGGVSTSYAASAGNEVVHAVFLVVLIVIIVTEESSGHGVFFEERLKRAHVGIIALAPRDGGHWQMMRKHKTEIGLLRGPEIALQPLGLLLPERVSFGL
jgi:hypothetical protein